MNRLLVYRVSTGILIGAGLAHVGTLGPRVVGLSQNVPDAAGWIVGAYVVSAVTALLACMLAAFLLWRAADRPAARALTLFLAFLAIFWGSLFRFVDLSRDSDSISVGLSYGGGWVSQSALAAFMLAIMSFLRFTALFPRPLTADRLSSTRAGWFTRLRVATLRPLPVWGAAVVLFAVIRLVPELIVLSIGPPPFEPADLAILIRTNVALMAFGYVLVPIVAAGIGVLNLRTSYRLADPAERRRMMWVVAGFSAAAWLVLAAIGVGIAAGTVDLPERVAIAIPVFFGLAPLLVVIGSAIGVLYSGAIDPGLALQRSTVYGILAALAVVAFAALENGLSGLVEDRLGLPGFSGSMIAGAIVAGVLIPIRRPLQSIVSRLATDRQDGGRDRAAS